VAVIIALALGAQFGILGMILAVPAACILRVLAKEFYWDRREARWSERTGKRRLDDDGPAPPKSPKEAETPAT
jgi:predicted PurR-regulated permease PerM